MKSSGRISRKEQIKQVAQNMFKERGYTGTSMRDLANVIGIEAASLYNHIKSKEEILQDICFDIAQQFNLSIVRVKQLTGTPDEKLTRAIHGHILVITNNLDASAVFLHEWRFLSEPHYTKFKNLRNRYDYEFRAIVQEGVDCGLFKPVDVMLFCWTFFSSVSWIYDWYKPDGKLSPEEIASELSHLFLEGIRR